MSVYCLLAAHLPVQVERRRDPDLLGRPLVVGGRPWDAQAVLDCCPLAERAGVRPGMRLSQAEALCPEAAFVPADEPAYLAAHRTLEQALRQFTDRVETVELGLLLADVAGLERTLGPAPRLVRRLTRIAGEASRLDVSGGLAGDRFTAEQAARAARAGYGQAVPPGEEAAFLSSLPISALPADAEFLRRLHLLGIRTLGALAALPRLALVRQFGAYAGFLHDLASGRDPRPVRPDAPPLVLEGASLFEPPLATRQALVANAERISALLAADLTRRGYQAEGLRVTIEDETGEVHTMAMQVEPPSADPQLLARRVAALLTTPTPSQPVVALTVALYPLRPAYLGASQLALFVSPREARWMRLQEVLRRLRDRFGEMVVLVASLLGPPPPRSVEVALGEDGLPCALALPDRILRVVRVYEHWRERRRWWARAVLRDYYRLELGDGQVRVVFRELEGGRWWMERRYI